MSALSLEKLGVGNDGECWLFSEQNSVRQIIGINRRLPDGRKLCVPGSHRGLTYTGDWHRTEGPVFVVEGASDVAAGRTLGLCVVGRPSNTGGVNYLSQLLRAHPGRKVLVIGERDEKDRATLNARHDPECCCCNHCFPGKHGASQTAATLTRRLEKEVQWSFLPAPAKDLRAFLNGVMADPNNEAAMGRIGISLTRRISNGIHT